MHHRWVTNHRWACIPVIAALLVVVGCSSHRGQEKSLKQNAKEVGHAVGTAAREVGKGAKKAGKAVGQAAKEGGKAFKEALTGC